MRDGLRCVTRWRAQPTEASERPADMDGVVGRVVLWTAVVVTAVGVVATAIRWAIDPAAPSTNCIAGGGSTGEAVFCVAVDAFASLLLWTAIVGVPSVLIAAGVAFLLNRRRNGK